ncbi:hypothetical protein TWF730_002839 [Orbilia blumenaviensis]|uniref:Clr5 domain-containing protein n=1 Tax=Orbilia blumenaviensis TaxID=1796055 RepID=A0AAV9U7A6_9PEZI
MKPSPEAWQLYESRIRKLYLEEKRSAAEVKRIIEEETDFTASLSQYHNQIQNVLRLRKNISKEDSLYYDIKKRKRDDEGKETRVKLCGILIDEANLRRKCQRKHSTVFERFQTENTFVGIPSTPPGLDVGTPTACSSPAPEISPARVPSCPSQEDGFRMIDISDLEDWFGRIDIFDLYLEGSFSRIPYFNHPMGTTWNPGHDTSGNIFTAVSSQTPPQNLTSLISSLKGVFLEDYVVGDAIWDGDKKTFNMLWDACVFQPSASNRRAELRDITATIKRELYQIAKSLQLEYFDVDLLIGDKRKYIEITARFGRLHIIHVLLNMRSSRDIDEAARIALDKGYNFLADFITRQSGASAQKFRQEGQLATIMGVEDTPTSQSEEFLDSDHSHSGEFEAFVNWSPKSFL